MSSRRAVWTPVSCSCRYGAAGFDRLVLPHVTDEQHAIVGAEPMQERVHLLRAREAGLVEDIQMRPMLTRLVSAREMALQGARRNARFGDLVRRARCGREAFDGVALALGAIPHGGQRRGLPGSGDTFECDHLIAAVEDLTNGVTLALAQTLMVLRDRTGRLGACERSSRVLPGSHDRDGVAFEILHIRRRERTARCIGPLLDAHELSRLRALLEF